MALKCANSIWWKTLA